VTIGTRQAARAPGSQPLEQPDLPWAFRQDLRPWAGAGRREVMEGGRE